MSPATLGIAFACLALASGGTAAIVAIRRGRAMLAADLHELRQSLTAARLTVDLTVAFADEPGEGLLAAADELARSYAVLADFERRFHEPVWKVAGRVRERARRLRGRGLFDAHEEVRRLARIWGEATRALGREFEFHGDITGVWLRGSRRGLTEALANLLANAIRHGDGRVMLAARRRGRSLRIEVADEGPGLGRPIAAIIGRNAGARRRLGPHGHGLAVAVRAARRLGGDIASAPSAGGASFVLELPVAMAGCEYDEFHRSDSRGSRERECDGATGGALRRPAGVTGDED